MLAYLAVQRRQPLALANEMNSDGMPSFSPSRVNAKPAR